MATTWTDYRGHKWPVTADMGTWLTAYENEALRRGYLKQGLDIEQTIGGAPASGGTHLKINGKACCIDTANWSPEMVWLARQMGADATWHRKQNWDGRGGNPHCHINLRGIVNRNANYQYSSTFSGVDHGHNGLANGAKDDGPKPLSHRTWQEGIAWAKAQQPPKKRITHLRVAEQNCASNHSGWTTRAPIVAKDVTKTKPHFISAVELYAAKRSVLSTLIVGTYAKKVSYFGKVQYARRNRNGWIKTGNSKTYTLGDGKHAVATRYDHRTTGATIVLATPHLDWPHDAGKHRAAEAKKLVAFLKADFKGLPWLIVGDCNDSHKPTDDRPHDSSGEVFRAAGLHDLYFDCDNAHKFNRDYNTANQGETPPPKNGIHIDRFWGSKEFTGVVWVCHVYSGKRGSDHWPVSMSIDITHLEK